MRLITKESKKKSRSLVSSRTETWPGLIVESAEGTRFAYSKTPLPTPSVSGPEAERHDLTPPRPGSSTSP